MQYSRFSGEIHERWKTEKMNIVRADLGLTSCEDPVEQGSQELLRGLYPCMRQSSGVPGQNAANRAYTDGLREAATRSTMTPELTSRWAMIRCAQGLLRSRYRVSRVSSCTTRPCCLLGTVVLQEDDRRTCRTSDARLAMLPALWEGHFGGSAEAAGDLRRACKPFSGLQGLGRREVHIPILPRLLRGGRGECGPSGEVTPTESRATASIRTDGPSRSSGRE